MTALGGFPWRCYDTCKTPADCVMDGCRKMKPLYATPEDRMFGRAQRDMTDEEKKDLETYCEAIEVDYRELEKHFRNEAAIILKDMLLAKYVGQENTPELRKQVVADLIALGEKKR